MQYLQKTVAAAVAPRSRSVWVLSNQSQSLRPGHASAMASRPADPALHAGDYEADPVVTTGDPQATENVAEEKPAFDEQQRQVDKPPSSWGKGKGTGTEPVSPTNKPSYPNASFPRLEKTDVTLQPDPSDHPINYTQKRRASQYATAATGLSLENFDLEKVSCVGLDGTPWPRDKENEEHKTDRDREDEREYYKHHKASPLSEIEFADTRKPITRVMHGTARLPYRSMVQVEMSLDGGRSSWTRLRRHCVELQGYGKKMPCVVTLMLLTPECSELYAGSHSESGQITHLYM